MRLMSASDDNLSTFFCDIPPMHLSPLIRLALNAASLDRTCSRVRSSRQNDEVLIRYSSQTSRQTGLELLSVHLWEEAYSLLGRTMLQRVRTAG